MALPVAGKRDHDVTVITVTFNSAAVIATLLATVPEHVRVIVVDNASSDDTVAVAGRWPNVTVLPLTSNSGFGAACNAGAALCDSPYVFFVNPDAWLSTRSRLRRRTPPSARRSIRAFSTRTSISVCVDRRVFWGAPAASARRR